MGHRDVLLHVGYHKTASTWLQDHVLADLDNVDLIGDDPEVFESLRRLKTDDEWDPSELRELIDARVGDKPVVVSYEGISGDPFSIPSHTERNAHRAQAVLPDADVLMVLRRQDHHIRSLFGQYVQEGGAMFMADWLESDQFDENHLRFDRAVEVYRDLFGPDHVTVLPYQCVRDDPHAFIEAAVEALPIHVDTGAGLSQARPRRSPTAIGAEVLRRLNRVARRSPRQDRPLVARVAPTKVVNATSVAVRRHLQPRVMRLRGSSKMAHRLDAELTNTAAAFATRYRESNRALADLVDWDPAELGYPT